MTIMAGSMAVAFKQHSFALNSSSKNAEILEFAFLIEVNSKMVV